MDMDILIEKAIQAKNKAYVPYSNFPVGAALITTSGEIYTGCNIENAAYPVGCCAERVAIFKAIANEERDFAKMAIVADTKEPVSPCGSCRQVMSEFFNRNMEICLTNLNKDKTFTTMEELLPFAFESKDLADK